MEGEGEGADMFDWYAMSKRGEQGISDELSTVRRLCVDSSPSRRASGFHYTMA
jgi:hypothetical protein